MPQPGTTVSPRIERRLAAIMAVDVASYSRLIGLDEIGTLNALKEHRRERIDPAIARHHGRIVKTMGDGLLVEFGSVVDAVACAVAVQRAMLAFNAGIHSDRQIILRIGINVGDIIIDGGDIFGDGVNVAARLEALCEPGGICISRSANEQVRDRLSLSFADLGEQMVKNIARAVGVFGLAAKDIAAIPEDALPQPGLPDQIDVLVPRKRHADKKLAAGAVVLVAILAVGGWWTLRDRGAAPAAATVAPAASRPAAYSAQDRRQSVIVLPFENSGGDSAQDGLAAEITRDLIEVLGSAGDMPVIPLMTVAAYRGKTLDLRAIGRDHDVHFVLTGNARSQDGLLIVSASIYDTVGLRQVWGRRLERTDGSGALHAIVQVIYESFWQTSIDEESARALREHPNDLDWRDLIMASTTTRLSVGTKENFLTRIGLIERALKIKPDYPSGLEREARQLAGMVFQGYSDDPKGDIAKAAAAADLLLKLQPESVIALRAKSAVLRAQGNWDEAEAIQRKALEKQPHESYRHGEMGTIQMALGRFPEALESFANARKFAGGGDPTYAIDTGQALALIATGNCGDAMNMARQAKGAYPPEGGLSEEAAWLALIASQSLCGQMTKAQNDLRDFLVKLPTLRNLTEVGKRATLATNARLIDGLRNAGMPEE